MRRQQDDAATGGATRHHTDHVGAVGVAPWRREGLEPSGRQCIEADGGHARHQHLARSRAACRAHGTTFHRIGRERGEIRHEPGRIKYHTRGRPAGARDAHGRLCRRLTGREAQEHHREEGMPGGHDYWGEPAGGRDTRTST